MSQPKTYSIRFTQSDKTPIIVRRKEFLDTAADIVFVGKRKLEFGEVFNENVLHLLEHFAIVESSLLPNTPEIRQTYGNIFRYSVVGQLWFNKTNQTPYVNTPSGWTKLLMSDNICGSSGTVSNGETVPLPQCASSYEECAIAVSPFSYENGKLGRYRVSVTAQGVVTAIYSNDGVVYYQGKANYIIVAKTSGSITVGCDSTSIMPTALPMPSAPPSATPAPTFTPTPTVTISVTPEPTPTQTVTPSVTQSATISVTPTATVSPTASAGATPTATPQGTPPVTPSITATNTATPSPTPAVTPTPSNQPLYGWVLIDEGCSVGNGSGPPLLPCDSLEVGSTAGTPCVLGGGENIYECRFLAITPTPTTTVTPTISLTPSQTPPVTPTNTSTPSPTAGGTPPVTPTGTPTNTPTPSVTASGTPPVTPTFTPTNTATPSGTPAVTPTRTPTSTPPVTPTRTGTPASTPPGTPPGTPPVTPTRTGTPASTPPVTPSSTPAPSNTPASTPPGTPPVTPTRTPAPSNTPASTPPSTPPVTPSPSAAPPTGSWIAISSNCGGGQIPPSALPPANSECTVNGSIQEVFDDIAQCSVTWQCVII